MIELFMNKNPPAAKGLIPGQVLRVHAANGKTWSITRFGAECIARCHEKEEENE